MQILKRRMIGLRVAVFASLFGCSAEPGDWHEAEEPIALQTEQLTGNHKVCLILATPQIGTWLDTVNVDDGWGAGTCGNLQTILGGNQFKLGCIFTSGFSIGTYAGDASAPQIASKPNPNCGW